MRKYYEHVVILVSNTYTKQSINTLLTEYYKNNRGNLKPSIGTNIDQLSKYDLVIVPVLHEEAIRKMEELQRNDINIAAIYDTNILDEYDKRYLEDSNILYISLMKDKLTMDILLDIYSWISVYHTVKENYI